MSYFIEPLTGCWFWLGRVFGRYGTAGSRWAHRIVYEEFNGPIPEGMTLDHLCRNTVCVNPNHLEPVSCDQFKKNEVPSRSSLR